MSLQVCHCGWSKVTTHHGLRTHQGKMGCTPRGVKVEESKQQYMWGNEGFTTNHKDLQWDVFMFIKSDTRDDYSDSSLQVCHCGWSKVTTHHGLRTHQGKMGCTPRGVKVEESKQQYMWGNEGFTTNHKDLQWDVFMFIKSDTRDDYSDSSLQVCHCGWSKVTTHHGLRTHQGKMGCTERARIPKREQCDRTKQREEVDERKRQPAKKTTVKKENTPLPPSTKSAAATAPYAECYKSYFTTSRPSLQAAAKSQSRRHLNDFSTGVQANRSAREHPTPTYPVTVDQLQVKDRKDQTLSQIADSRVRTGNWKINSRTEPATTAATIKEQPTSPLAIPPQSSRTATNSKSGLQPHDFATDVQVNPSIRERPAIPPWGAAVQPKKEDRNDQTSKVESLVRERPATTYPATVVKPKDKHREDQTLSQDVPVSATIKGEPKSPLATPQQLFHKATNSKASHPLQDCSTGVQARQERVQSDLQQKMTLREEKMSQIISAARACESVPDSTSSNSQTNSAAAEATTKQDPKSLCETAQPDFSTGMMVKELAQMFSATATEETAVRPKGKHGEERKLSQEKLSVTTTQETAVRPKENDRVDQKLSQNGPNSTSAGAQMKPASAEATTEEDPKSSCETAQLSDFSTGMKVKDLVQMFSATTTQETAVRPKGKHGEERKLSQLFQVRQDVRHKAQMREQKVAPGRSVEACKGSVDAEWLEMNCVFSEVVRVVEDAKQKSADLSFSVGALRATSSTMVEHIHQKLDKLSFIERKWISKFAVDVKLDQSTAHRCLVSDGKKVSTGAESQEAAGVSGRFGSVLGLNRFTSGRAYWEVEVSNKTGWDVGVARRDAKRKVRLSLTPDNGHWVIARYEDEKYAALSGPPVSLSLKEKPEKVGVFVDFEERLVSFYDVTAQSHIYSFTECSFTGEICPYFSLHLREGGGSADPLIISTLRPQ